MNEEKSVRSHEAVTKIFSKNGSRLADKKRIIRITDTGGWYGSASEILRSKKTKELMKRASKIKVSER